MSTRQEQINAALIQLAENLGTEIAGTVAVSSDGIVLASRMSSEVNADRVGAVAATMIGVTRRVAGELRIGTTEEAIIKANNGYFLVLPAGETALLAVNLRQGSNLGLVRIESRECAAVIGRAL